MSYIPIIASAIFLLLLLLERFDPLREVKHEVLKRLVVNFWITALAVLVNAISVQPGSQFMLNWTAQKPFGLLHLVELPTVVSGVLGFLLMDLSFYYWHRANHQFPFLWRFHNAHHIDPDMDVSTGFRFHFIEIFLSTGFRVLQVTLIGVSLWVYTLNEFVYLTNTLFHHSNLKLPIWLERWLNFVLVTPRMHGIHHSQVQQETNSNFSVVFSLWDRLHRTLNFNITQSEIAIGVPAYTNSEDNTVLNILLMPFRQQRNYWCHPDQAIVKQESAQFWISDFGFWIGKKNTRSAAHPTNDQ